MPEMLDDENIPEVFEALKKSGKIRFSALSMHNDVAANLDKTVELGHYDGAMIAYNMTAMPPSSVPFSILTGMGLVAMKVARSQQSWHGYSPVAYPETE